MRLKEAWGKSANNFTRKLGTKFDQVLFGGIVIVSSVPSQCVMGKLGAIGSLEKGISETRL